MDPILTHNMLYSLLTGGRVRARRMTGQVPPSRWLELSGMQPGRLWKEVHGTTTVTSLLSLHLLFIFTTQNIWQRTAGRFTGHSCFHLGSKCCLLLCKSRLCSSVSTLETGYEAFKMHRRHNKNDRQFTFIVLFGIWILWNRLDLKLEPSNWLWMLSPKQEHKAVLKKLQLVNRWRCIKLGR